MGDVTGILKLIVIVTVVVEVNVALLLQARLHLVGFGATAIYE